MEKARTRRIGPLGTVSRILVGGLMVGAAVAQQVGVGEWLLGAVVMPGLFLGWQSIRVRRDQAPIRATGPVGHLVTLVAFLIFYLTTFYAPPWSVTSGAALIFFGGSMLVAAIRGYRGCEVLAVSNWVLRRDDQVGCVLFSPIDRLESARSVPSE